MTSQSAGSPQDIDFTIGFKAVILAGVLSLYNLYLAYVTKEVTWVLIATAMLFYFFFAPVFLSKVLDGDQWTLSRRGNSIWSAIMWGRYIKKHPEGS